MAHQQRRTRQQYRKAAAELLRNAYECVWCLRPISTTLPVGHPQKATADHYVPLSRGGADGLDNLVAACAWCNSHRGNKSPEDFVAWLRKIGRLPKSGGSRDW